MRLRVKVQTGIQQQLRYALQLMIPIIGCFGGYAQARYPVELNTALLSAGTAPLQSSTNQGPPQLTTLAADLMSNGNPNLDCGAKIDLANASLGPRPGTINVSRACGMTWSSPVTLSPGHNLHIVEPGIYTFEGIFAEGQNQISGLGSSTVLKLAPQESYPSDGIAGIRLSDANDQDWAAKNVTISNLALDGDYEESALCQNGLACATAVLMRGTAVSPISDVSISHVLFSGWAGLDIRFGNYSLPPSNILITHNIFKNCVTQCVESTGFRNNVEISDNQFLGWGMRCPSTCDAIFMYPNLPKSPAYDQHDLRITGNTFINLYHASKFATELFGGSDAGARFTNVTYIDNFHDDLNTHGGGSGFSATVLYGVVSKNVWKNGCGTQRCGIELSASNVFVSNNDIQNGTISIGGNDDAGQVFTAANDAVSQNKITIAALNGKGIKVASVSNAIVSGNSISTDGSHGSCDAIIVGIRGSSFGTAKNVHIENNTLNGGGVNSNPSTCSGIRIADSPKHPGSAILVSHNHIQGFGVGVLDSQDDTSLKDIAVEANVFAHTSKPIHLATPGARVTLRGNTLE